MWDDSVTAVSTFEGRIIVSTNTANMTAATATGRYLLCAKDRRFQNYVFRTHAGLEHTEKPSFAYGAKDGDSIIHVFLQRAGES